MLEYISFLFMDSKKFQYCTNELESRWQSKWQEENLFSAQSDSEKSPYSIVIPPPNVTGILHLGHILNNTLQDVLARRARQGGFEVLWLPGTDHAGIATQNRVEKFLQETQGKSRENLGREAFLKAVWEWKEKHGGTIIEQLKRLGCSCDWNRERFTMDKDYSSWVAKVFNQLFRQNLIYRGKRMVNWCPSSCTALSDEEVLMKENSSKLYFIKYFLAENPNNFIQIATTRPETLMGDVAIAVHPKDSRYQKWIGKNVLRPFPKAEIPVIADERVEKSFGTGALKITPFHDKLDFLIGQDHKLPFIEVIDEKGKVKCPECPDFHQMDRFVARREVARHLQKEGLLIKIEEHQNHIGFSERANVVIEPRVSMQWFLHYPCVKEAKEAVENELVSFYPEHWEKTYMHWLEKIQDWCISRQLWWGHQIPVWYKREKFEELKLKEKLDASHLESGDIYVGENPPSDKENWIQEEDVLDTWFSSWLWPFAAMDEKTRNKFYPTKVLITGPDILFFWVARMLMAGYHFTEQAPFREVFFTSIIRDSQGRKMSKSLGNSPNPLDLMEKYGADGLRFGLMRIAPTGLDIRFEEKKIEEGRNFATKLANAANFRYLAGDLADGIIEISSKEYQNFTFYQIDILQKLDSLQKKTQEAYQTYDFHSLVHSLYTFFWSEYCDRFLEVAKSDLKKGNEKQNAMRVMDIVLWHYLQLCYPVLPHIAEELAHSLGYLQEGEFLCQKPLLQKPLLSSLDKKMIKEASNKANLLYENAQILRDMKARNQLSSRRDLNFIIKKPNKCFGELQEVLKILVGAEAFLEEAKYQPDENAAFISTELAEFYLPLENLVDFEEEVSRLQKKMGEIKQEILNCQKKLQNAQFVEKAPQKIVMREKQRLQDWQQKQKRLEETLARQRISK